MIRGNLLIAFMLFATGILTIISSYFYGLGSLSEPSAGTFPFGIGIAFKWVVRHHSSLAR